MLLGQQPNGSVGPSHAVNRTETCTGLPGLTKAGDHDLLFREYNYIWGSHLLCACCSFLGYQASCAVHCDQIQLMLLTLRLQKQQLRPDHISCCIPVPVPGALLNSMPSLHAGQACTACSPVHWHLLAPYCRTQYCALLQVLTIAILTTQKTMRTVDRSILGSELHCRR